jgi:hypothetical protein
VPDASVMEEPFILSSLNLVTFRIADAIQTMKVCIGKGRGEAIVNSSSRRYEYGYSRAGRQFAINSIQLSRVCFHITDGFPHVLCLEWLFGGN